MINTGMIVMVILLALLSCHIKPVNEKDKDAIKSQLLPIVCHLSY